MNAPWRFLSPIFVMLAASVLCGNPISAYASGGADGAAAKQPVPNREKKVLTNDDLELKYGNPSVATEAKNSQAVSASTQATPSAAAARPTARRERLAPEQDPQWYAQQTVSFSDEIARINSEAQRLLQFRAPGNTPRAGTGLILNAPCEGISTDNRIAQLLSRRQGIEAQMSDLEDTARRNGMPPGLFVEASAIAQAASASAPPTAAQQRATLAERVGQLSDQLAETRAVVADMAADTAGRRMTLLRPTGYGANMTTDLLQRLGAQLTALQSEINSVADDALRAGVPARDLP
ncbi:MAG TPA: hypothetical protein VEX69_10720 [Candidatus Limnocylindria bacterium]|nr:hypothetical protein [Candidatus Limnocylindria bacterium]